MGAIEHPTRAASRIRRPSPNKDQRMPKKKRLIVMLAVLLAVLAGVFVKLWVAVAVLSAMAVLMGGKRLFRYVRAHRGGEALALECRRYHTDVLIETLKAAEKPGESFTFVVLGDNRGTKQIPPVIHRLAREENPAFLVNTGDLVRFGRAVEYVDRYLPHLRAMEPVPVFSVPGNHDRGARNDFSGYLAVHGADRFSFDYGSCRFVGVNNGKRARMQADDMDYLRRELAKSPVRHKFVFIHIPPTYFEDGVVTVSKRRGFVENREVFHTLMVENQVDEVFMGHIHGYATKLMDGVRYTLTAGAGAPLSKRLPLEAQVYNYVVLHVAAQGCRREVVRCIDGEWVRGE
jgi:predicted phosphodiesterase